MFCQPERLFYKDGIKVFSEAVAGTRARGITESKDNGSGIELLLRLFRLICWYSHPIQIFLLLEYIFIDIRKGDAS